MNLNRMITVQFGTPPIIILFLNYSVRLREPRKVIINRQPHPAPRNNSLSGGFQNKFCLLNFKVTFNEEKC